jgi:hypothetical protein
VKKPLPKMDRKADQVGAAASGWKMRSEHETALTTWVVNHPTAHALWSQWIVSLVHLRPIEGTPDPKKHYPEAEFELLVVAQDPDHYITNPDDFDLYPLTPIDVVKQFHGVNDDVATHIVEKLIEAVLDGGLSPDQDHRALWEGSLETMVEHFTVGHTPPELLN